MSEQREDVVVIGSGPAGAVAATLCAEAGRSVLMIEEGEDLPIDSAPHFSRAELLQKYRGAGVGVAFGRSPLGYFEGRCVGGGSEINRGLYHRATDALLEKWSSQFGVRDLSGETMRPHFEACEATAKVEYLPGDAPLFSTRLRDGAEALGWSACEAARLFHYSPNGGRKQSMTETFIPRFRAAGGRIRPNTRARTIRYENGSWLVDCAPSSGRSPDGSHVVRADHLLLACGAVQTPTLLRRSGIKRNVGNSLRFHPMIKMVAEFADEVNRPGDLDPVHQIKEFEPEIGMGCSISTPPVLAMALAGHEQFRNHQRVTEAAGRMGLYYAQSNFGVAKVRPLPWTLDPFVSVRFTAAEKRRMLEAVVSLGEALFEAGARTLYPSLAGCPPIRSREELRQLPDKAELSNGALTSVHSFSACPMGEDERIGAVDSFGKVHGCERLHVVGSSTLCTPTGVNPQGTVMAVAHRNTTELIRRNFR